MGRPRVKSPRRFQRVNPDELAALYRPDRLPDLRKRLRRAAALRERNEPPPETNPDKWR